MRNLPIRWTLILIGLTILSRAIVVLAMGTAPLEGDAGHYHDLATNLKNGHGFAFSENLQYPWLQDGSGDPIPTARRPFLFPAMLSVLYGLGLSSDAMIWIHVFVAGLTVLGLMKLGREVGLGPTGAALAGLAYIIYPHLALSVRHLLTETWTIFFLVWGAYALARAVKTESLKAYAVTGLLLGLATLIRPTTFVFPVVLFLFLVWPKRTSFKGWATLAIVFYALLLPWGIRNAQVIGKFDMTFNSRGYNLFMGSYPPTRGLSNLPPSQQPPELLASFEGKSEVEVNHLYTKAAIKNVLDSPGEFAKLVTAKAILCWFQTKPLQNMFLPTPRSFLIGAPLLLLGIFGFMRLRHQGEPTLWIPLLIIFYFVAIHMASVATIRYNMPSVPFMLIGVGASLAHIMRRIGLR